MGFFHIYLILTIYVRRFATLYRSINTCRLFIIFEKKARMAGGIDWSVIAAKVAITIFNLHQWGDYQTIEICGRSCNVQIKGRLHRLEWVWDGRCECGGITGSSRHYKSQNGAVQNAIQDYVTKAGQAGQIPLEQIQQYR
jgi:hypothetical protein